MTAGPRQVLKESRICAPRFREAAGRACMFDSMQVRTAYRSTSTVNVLTATALVKGLAFFIVDLRRMHRFHFLDSLDSCIVLHGSHLRMHPASLCLSAALAESKSSCFEVCISHLVIAFIDGFRQVKEYFLFNTRGLRHDSYYFRCWCRCVRRYAAKHVDVTLKQKDA